MKERPIIFKAPMVRAILDGEKTQTRRVVSNKGCNLESATLSSIEDGVFWFDLGGFLIPMSPRFEPGDILWVRETFQIVHFTKDPEDTYHAKKIPHTPFDEFIPGYKFWTPIYAAVNPAFDNDIDDRGFPWRPSIHMPKWASRIRLRVTNVRCERVRKITNRDAMAEGIGHLYGYTSDVPAADGRIRFAELWKSIYKKSGETWIANPWVWVYEFERVKP